MYSSNSIPASSARAARSTRRGVKILIGGDFIITNGLSGVRRGMLELLRDVEKPILAGDLPKQFAEHEGFGAEIDGISPTLAGRF